MCEIYLCEILIMQGAAQELLVFYILPELDSRDPVYLYAPVYFTMSKTFICLKKIHVCLGM